MAESRPDPIYIEPKVAPPTPEQASAVIFIHGFSDEGASFRELVEHYQTADKLPHTLWVLPTAGLLGDDDPRVRAWYRRPTLVATRALAPADDDDDDHAGILASCEYILALVEQLESARGIPAARVAVGGFSQGGALALVLGLASARAGRFAGIFSLMGYLPRLEAIRERQQQQHGGGEVARMPVLVARAGRDEFLARWYHEACWEALGAMGVRGREEREYDVTHSVEGMEVRRDLCGFLEDRCGF